MRVHRTVLPAVCSSRSMAIGIAGLTGLLGGCSPESAPDVGTSSTQAAVNPLPASTSFGVSAAPSGTDADADGFSADQGDCDDARATFFPGASDALGDGLDQDCGGKDGAQPSVGLKASTYTSIQAAIDAAATGDTIWVGPGTRVEHSIDFLGKAATLASTHGAQATVIDAQNQGTVIRFLTGEGPGTVVTGFTLTGGYSDGTTVGNGGGGIYAYKASPTIQDCIITGNRGENAGGALVLESELVFRRCTFSANSMIGYLENGAGGLFLNLGAPRLEHCLITQNRGTHGGIYSNSPAQLDNCAIVRNFGAFTGAFDVRGRLATLNNCLIASNEGRWGSIALRSGSVTLNNCTVADNVGSEVGGVYAHATANGASGGPYPLTIHNSILAWNSGFNLLIDHETWGAGLDVTYTDLYNPGATNSNLLTVDSSNREVDPRFIFRSGVLKKNNYHLDASSPLKDAGDPGSADADGSRSQPGAYGGPQGDWSGYQDSDGDGMPDAWEKTYGLDPLVANGTQDLDSDGATNLQEYRSASHPGQSDTDADGAKDGAEIGASRSPIDWYSQPGVTGPATAKVPGHFASLQSALDAIADAGAIEIQPGTYAQGAEIIGKEVVIRSRDGLETTSLNGSGRRVLQIEFSQIELEGLTLTGGRADQGAGMQILYSKGSLRDMAVTDCETPTSGTERIGRGGGAYVQGSTLTLDRMSFTDNVAVWGGGLNLRLSRVEMHNMHFSNNLADSGAATETYQSELVSFDSSTFTGNHAYYYGGALFLNDDSNDGTPTILVRGCLFEGNSAGQNDGGAIEVLDSKTRIENSWFTGNTAINGGAISLSGSIGGLELANVAMVGNSARRNGGAMFVDNSGLRLEQTVMVGNDAPLGGGMYFYEGPDVVILNSILAYNTRYNLFWNRRANGGTCEGCIMQVEGSDFYSPTRQNTNLPTGTNYLTLEPGFQSYSGGAVADDLHLRTTSWLIDQGVASVSDPEGSRSDPGIFGGPLADEWDRDGDGVPAWFWPGTIDDAPEGYDPAKWDSDDGDGGVSMVARDPSRGRDLH